MIENLKDMNVHERVLGVMQNVEWVSKTGEVSYNKTKYAYVTETQILADVRPWMVEYGLVMYPVSIEKHTSKDGLTQASVMYEIVAAGYDGEENRSMFVSVLAEGADATDKGAYKMMTGAIKVAIRQAFLIITGDNSDPEATDNAGQPTGATRVEYPMDKVRSRLDHVNMLDNPELVKMLKAHKINLDSQDVDAKTVSNAKALTKFARSMRDGADISVALGDLDNALG